MKIKQNIIIMYAISLLQGMVFYGAVATLYRQNAGVSVFQITIIESISLALALVLELPWGILAEKIGYKNTMLICNVIYFVSKIVFWKADGFFMFLLERVMLSVIIAGLSGVDTSILYLSCDEKSAQKVFGIYDSLGTAGLLIAAAVYSLFMKENYSVTGFATVVTYGIAMIATFFLREVKTAEKQASNLTKDFVEILKDTLHRRELLFFLIGIALFSECHQTITVFLNQLQYVRCGMENAAIGWIYILVTIAGLLGARSAAFTEKLGRRNAGIVLFLAGLAACITLMTTENVWLSVLSILVLRISFSLLMPLAKLIENQQITHKNRATALSINSVIMDGIAIGTNLVFGKASDWNLPSAFGIGAAFMVMGLGLFIYSVRKM